MRSDEDCSVSLAGMRWLKWRYRSTKKRALVVELAAPFKERRLSVDP